MLYLGLTSLLFFLRYALLGRNKARVQVYYPVLIALFLFSAFRYAVGCDWYGYYNQFDVAENFDWATLTSIREPVWWADMESRRKQRPQRKTQCPAVSELNEGNAHQANCCSLSNTGHGHVDDQDGEQ